MKKLFLLCFLCIIILPNVCRIAESDLASDRRALLAIRTAIGARFLPWNISDYTPCNWTGVACLHGRVVELRLQHMGLIDQLPPVHENLTQQRNLTLPPDIGNLASLRNLYLQGNLFSGEIPEFLFNLRNLVCLNLAHNNFTGRVSVNFNKLTKLTSLYLEGNQLSGFIPYLNLASLKHFNVSFNNLTGGIPKTLSSMPASSFEGNFLCGKPLLLCNGSSIGDNHKLSGAGIACIVMGCFIGCFCQRKVIKHGGDEATEDLKQREKFEHSIEDGMAVNNTTPKFGGKKALWVAKGEATENVEQKEDIEVSVEEGVAESDHAATALGGGDTLGAVTGQSSLEFDLEDLLRAPAELLGKGTFGTTYKATFETGRTVAIKRLKDFNVSEKEFEDMVEAIEKMNNQNLVPIRAYYYSEDQMLLVYEYMHMGSLYALLHGDKGGSRSSLNWETRTSIALGAARAIMHIHTVDPSTCHGNIKSSNIFLTATSKVRVSEVGLVNFGGSTKIEGYVAPELTETRKLSQKADVYSFGVLLLELVTGKDPTESHLKDEGLDLPKWLLSAVNEEWTSAVFDVELLQYENVEEIMLQFLELAFSCTAQHPDNRPSMAEVVKQIKVLCSPSLQDDRDPAMTENVFGQIYKGPKAWKIYTRSNRELQQRFNARANENTVAGGLVFFGNVQNVFDLEDLLRASAEVLGKGTFGTSYKAVLETGTIICVKRLKDLKVKGEEFRKIIEAVGKINHENLICLRAYYHSKDENLLVQDYMPMGSLSVELYGSRGYGRTPLNWENRCSIALGVARAIEYIHSQSSAMCHGDIKSSNILLTKTLEVRVSDFGLSRITENYTRQGYRAPEVSDASKVSQKADVYSFGILLLELLTGKAPTHYLLEEEGLDLPRWVQSVVKEEWAAEVIDVELLRYQDALEDMVQLLQIALSCIAEDPDKRPSMTKLKFQIKKLVRPSSKVGDGDKSLQQMEDGKLRFGHMISIPDD